jgi:nitric oxide reductase NorQ protein
MREVASTRVLIAAGMLVAKGVTLRDAARVAVAGPLTGDGKLTAGLVEVVEACLPQDAS